MTNYKPTCDSPIWYRDGTVKNQRRTKEELNNNQIRTKDYKGEGRRASAGKKKQE